MKNYFGNLNLFIEELKKEQEAKQKILVLSQNKARAERMAEIFEDRKLTYYDLKPLPQCHFSPGKINLSYGQINYGFSIPSLSFIVMTEQEIFG